MASDNTQGFVDIDNGDDAEKQKLDQSLVENKKYLEDRIVYAKKAYTVMAQRPLHSMKSLKSDLLFLHQACLHLIDLQKNVYKTKGAVADLRTWVRDRTEYCEELVFEDFVYLTELECRAGEIIAKARRNIVIQITQNEEDANLRNTTTLAETMIIMSNYYNTWIGKFRDFPITIQEGKGNWTEMIINFCKEVDEFYYSDAFRMDYLKSQFDGHYFEEVSSDGLCKGVDNIGPSEFPSVDGKSAADIATMVYADYRQLIVDLLQFKENLKRECVTSVASLFKGPYQRLAQTFNRKLRKAFLELDGIVEFCRNRILIIWTGDGDDMAEEKVSSYNMLLTAPIVKGAAIKSLRLAVGTFLKRFYLKVTDRLELHHAKMKYVSKILAEQDIFDDEETGEKIMEILNDGALFYSGWAQWLREIVVILNEGEYLVVSEDIQVIDSVFEQYIGFLINSLSDEKGFF